MKNWKTPVFLQQWFRRKRKTTLQKKRYVMSQTDFNLCEKCQVVVQPDRIQEISLIE